VRGAPRTGSEEHDPLRLELLGKALNHQIYPVLRRSIDPVGRR